MEANPKFIDWRALSANPEAIWIVEKNPHKINFLELTRNNNAGKLLIKHVNLLLKEVEKNDNWTECGLSKNPCALPLLQAYPELIDWEYLAWNTNPKAID